MVNLSDNLKDKLYKSILNYGPTDKRTVKLSQMLDIQVVAEQKELMTRNHNIRC